MSRPFPEEQRGIDSGLAWMKKLRGPGLCSSRQGGKKKGLSNIYLCRAKWSLRWGQPGIWPGWEGCRFPGEHPQPYPQGFGALMRWLGSGALGTGSRHCSFYSSDRRTCNCFCCSQKQVSFVKILYPGSVWNRKWKSSVCLLALASPLLLISFQDCLRMCTAFY